MNPKQINTCHMVYLWGALERPLAPGVPILLGSIPVNSVPTMTAVVGSLSFLCRLGLEKLPDPLFYPEARFCPRKDLTVGWRGRHGLGHGSIS